MKNVNRLRPDDHGGGAERKVSSKGDGTAADQEQRVEVELADPGRKVETLPVIEQAKGMLMGYYGITADVALGVLSRWSMRSNTKLSLVCAILVAEGSRSSDHPAESLRYALNRWQPTSNDPAGRRARPWPGQRARSRG